MLGFLAYMLTPRFRGMRRGVVAILVVAMLFLSGAALANAADSPITNIDSPQAGPIPELTISLTPNQLQAEVTQSQLGAVTFGGEWTVDQMRVGHSTVTLTAVVNTGWPVVLSDQTFQVSGPGSEEFQVTVIVPPATSSLIAGNVIVTGQCKAPGLAPVVASAHAIVTVGAYYRGRIITSDGNIELDAGESSKVNVTIHNDGNTPADMRIFALNQPEEVQISFSESQFHIQTQEYIHIKMEVKAVKGAGSGAYPLLLVVEAETREGAKEEVAVHNVTVYIPSLKAKLGFSGMMTIIIVCVVVVGVAVFWKMGKLKIPKGIKFPKRSKTEIKETV